VLGVFLFLLSKARPLTAAAIGIGGIAIILWLILSRPF